MFKISKSKKAAVLLSYIIIVIQALSTMLLTTLYLNNLGKDAYGLYQMIYSVASYILILDLGIPAVMTRYIAEYDAKGQKTEIENFAFHFGLIVILIVVAVVGIGLLVNANIENIYKNLNPAEYVLSHRMFSLMIVQLSFTVICHYFTGICEAYEHFVFVRIVNIVKLLLSIALNIIFIKCGVGVMGIVAVNTIVILFGTIVTSLYSILVLKFKVKLHYWQPKILKPAMLLMLAMLLQAIVGYVNSSVDKTILGIMTTKADVTVYSIAAMIVTLFNTIPTAISSVFQPRATRLVVDGADSEMLTDFVIRPGRFQFMLMGGFISGFVVFGRDFIACWAGNDMLNAWIYVLIILIPNSVPLMQNTCLGILNAMDKRIFRSIILAVLTVVNVIISVILIRLIGPIGAPLGTSIAFILGHCIAMNIYYKKRIGLNVGRMFREILSGSWECALAALLLTLPLMLWKNDGSWLILFAKAIIFCLIYAFALFRFAMNQEEKNTVLNLLKRMIPSFASKTI